MALKKNKDKIPKEVHAARLRAGNVRYGLVTRNGVRRGLKKKPIKNNGFSKKK